MRSYSNTSTEIGPMGRSWRHSLEWKVTRTQTPGTVEFRRAVIAVRPALGRFTAFIDLGAPTGFSPGPDGGAVSVDASGWVHLVGADGTRADFDDQNRLRTLQEPGALPISVTYAGNAAIYATPNQSLTITTYASGVNAGRVETVTAGGETWLYGYDSSQNLTTVTAPDPSTASTTDTITFTYAYTGGQLTGLSRTVGGVTTPVASWTIAGGRVTAADEPALEQPLTFSYSAVGDDGLQTTVKRSATETLAVYTNVNGMISSVESASPTTPLGGAGVPVPFRAGTTEAVSGISNWRWRTKTDKNGNLTLFESYDERGNPGRIVEGWKDDAAPAGVFTTADGFARLREYQYHPRLARPTKITEQSALTGMMERITTLDFDDPADATQNPLVANDKPTDRVYARLLTGKRLDASGAVTTLSTLTKFAYNAAGQVTRVDGPRTENLTEHLYDAVTGYRTATRRYLNGSGSSYLETTYANFDGRGNPQTVTEPNGRQTLFTYDTAGRVKTVKPPYGGADPTISFTYDVDGNLVRVDFPPDTLGQPYFLRLGYDTKSRITFLADARGNAMVYEYTAGRATREALYKNFVDLASRGTLVGDGKFSFDQAGRLAKAFNPLFADDSVYTQLTPDGNGNPTSVQDENGRSDTLVYDALDRLTEIQQIRTATYTTRFAYDPLSNVKQVTDAAVKATDYKFDDAGNLAQVISPDTGTTRYLFDAAGNLVQKIEDATGSPRTTLYTFDGLDRLTRIDFPSDPDWVFTYDSDVSKNQKGRLASVTNGVVTTELEYTQRGQVGKESTVFGGKRYSVTYGFDAGGNLTNVTTPSGVTLTTSYAGSRPTTLAVATASAVHVIRGIEFRPFGPRTQAIFPPESSADPLVNTVTSTRDYNLRYQLTELDVAGLGGTVLDQSYSYRLTGGGSAPTDPGPNLDFVDDHRDPSQSRYFFYDGLDRLWKQTSTAGVVQHQFLYDAVGNRTQETTAAGVTNTTYATGTDRIAQSTGASPRYFAHDAFGNRIWAGASAYAGTPSHVYDQSNRLVEVRDPATQAVLGQYAYDAFGRRYRKLVGTQETLFFYDLAGHLLERVRVNAASADPSRTHVWLEDELVGVVDQQVEVGVTAGLPSVLRELPREFVPLGWIALLAASGTVLVLVPVRRRGTRAVTAAVSVAALVLVADTCGPTTSFYWVHGDHLGTPLAVTNNPPPAVAEKVVWRATYAPFGLATVNQDPDGDGIAFALDVRFPGQVFDAESGLHYNYYRTYDPAVGRYLESDPGSRSGTLATYAYAAGTPLRFSDRAGLCVEDLCVGEGLALAAFAKATEAAGYVALSGAAAYWIGKFFHEAADPEATADDGQTCPAPTNEHDEERKALNDLLNDLTNQGNKPLTSDDADAALDLANELGIKGARDDRDEAHWEGGPHIHIPGSGIRHIPARPR